MALPDPYLNDLDSARRNFEAHESSLAQFQARIFFGAGSPESVVTAQIGSIYLRRDGGAATSFYVKESGTGNTGWIGK